MTGEKPKGSHRPTEAGVPICRALRPIIIFEINYGINFSP